MLQPFRPVPTFSGTRVVELVGKIILGNSKRVKASKAAHSGKSTPPKSDFDKLGVIRLTHGSGIWLITIQKSLFGSLSSWGTPSVGDVSAKMCYSYHSTRQVRSCGAEAGRSERIYSMSETARQIR